MLLVLFLAFFAPSAHAEGSLMTGADFRALAEGWTLHFEDEAGEYFGSERFMADGETVWRPRGGACLRGLWTEDRDRICFFYRIGGACWRLYRTAENEILAVDADEDAPEPRLRLRIIRRDKSDLICPDNPGV